MEDPRFKLVGVPQVWAHDTQLAMALLLGSKRIHDAQATWVIQLYHPAFQK